MTKLRLAYCSLVVLGCERFDPPPSAELEGETDGAIAETATNPLIVRFSERIVPASLTLAVVPDVRDPEGNLLDEQQPARQAEYLATRLFVFERGKPGDARATYTLEQAERLQIAPLAGNELGPSPLMLVVEPGLEDLEGNSTRVRLKIPFSVLNAR